MLLDSFSSFMSFLSLFKQICSTLTTTLFHFHILFLTFSYPVSLESHIGPQWSLSFLNEIPKVVKNIYSRLIWQKTWRLHIQIWNIIIDVELHPQPWYVGHEIWSMLHRFCMEFTTSSPKCSVWHNFSMQSPKTNHLWVSLMSNCPISMISTHAQSSMFDTTYCRFHTWRMLSCCCKEWASALLFLLELLVGLCPWGLCWSSCGWTSYYEMMSLLMGEEPTKD